MYIKFNNDTVLVTLLAGIGGLAEKQIVGGKWYELAGASPKYVEKGEELIDITFPNGDTAMQIYASEVVLVDKEPERYELRISVR